jgi:hypothetical protein
VDDEIAKERERKVLPVNPLGRKWTSGKAKPVLSRLAADFTGLGARCAGGERDSGAQFLRIE